MLSKHARSRSDFVPKTGNGNDNGNSTSTSTGTNTITITNSNSNSNSNGNNTGTNTGGPSAKPSSSFPTHRSAQPSGSGRRATVTGAPHCKISWDLPDNDGSAPLSRLDTILKESTNINLELIAHLLAEDHLDTETYGVAESRDGFFDAFFLKPPRIDYSELVKSIEPTLPDSFRTGGSFSPKRMLMKQWDGIKAVTVDIFKTRSGLLLLKSFTAFYIAYILCLIPPVREWLGRYSYIMVVSTIVNHPGRTVGSQLDGAILTIIGTAAGLGWGSVGLLLSTSTSDARTGYAAVLALFLALFMAFVAFIRSFFFRSYQLVLCGGVAITYTCLADIDGHVVKWDKIYAYAIPWMLGQAIAFVVCVVLFPDAGARPLAEEFHRAFGVLLDGLAVPRPRGYEMRQQLAQTFFDLSTACRDMRLDITVSRFRTDDVAELRNLMQGVVRGLLSMKLDNELFENLLHSRPTTARSYLSAISEWSVEGRGGSRPGTLAGGSRPPSLSYDDSFRKGVRVLQGPTQELVAAMVDGLRACDAVFMDISGHRSSLGPPKDVSSDIESAEAKIAAAAKKFDDAETALSGSQEVRGYNPEIMRLLGLARSVRMTSGPINKLMTGMRAIQARSHHIRVELPSNDLWKSLTRTNAQVRHDRGSVTPTSYNQTFAKISELINKIKAREHLPISQNGFMGDSDRDDSVSGVPGVVDPSQRPDSLRHRTWRTLHFLQGFEGKYALRVVVVTGLLSAPGYVRNSRAWWNQYDAWWAVCMAWIMSHTMVGGSLVDLFVRSLCVVLGALWSGFSFSAGHGNPFVMAVFALLYMLPMMYRFTRSSHARSGLAGCLSFTVTSLGLVTSGGASPPAAVRGLSFLVGIVAATMVSWLLWPFVARHQLRKSVSAMLFFQSVVYRDMVAKYVYYEHSKPPSKSDVEQSEILESGLREGFIRMRQLLHLTRHELRLRAPFDPIPYLALIDACEAFFDDLVTVRQAALFYRPGFARIGEAARMVLGHRRDAVAVMLTNLYVLSGALRAGVKVPRYLPSAAVSRKRLLDKMNEVEADLPESHDPETKTLEKWALVYMYSYNESLTRCVAHLEAMERWTKLILGENGFTEEFQDDSSDDEDEYK
ncbi:related to BRE4 Protein involved in endocytosis [Cephalotrichum gorgonifer]|uniref:Related to BRE4 Protein involved in endocytosis n=1 Tax=Cephalotrichum gorgonifer TaxID=2041049 RepID=A0AAE8SXP3_9PEZI|nr:related to BRE4 Protein involved in endocytosis [Cephalotrichum gorgonifer]